MEKVVCDYFAPKQEVVSPVFVSLEKDKVGTYIPPKHCSHFFISQENITRSIFVPRKKAASRVEVGRWIFLGTGDYIR